MEDKAITKRNLWLFPLGTVGRDMVYNLVTYFLLSFVLYTKGLNTAQLGVITVIMIAARVFDALNDPIMGNIIERTRTRWGKFKPWLVIGNQVSGLYYASGKLPFLGTTQLKYYQDNSLIERLDHQTAMFGRKPAILFLKKEHFASDEATETQALLLQWMEANGYRAVVDDDHLTLYKTK